MKDDAWDVLVADHRTAVDEFSRQAEGVAEDRWTQPRAPGKWSPAEEVEHVGRAYRGLCRAMDEGIEIPQLTSRPKAWLLRLLVLPRVLRGKFPRGARAPRPTRPQGDLGSRAELVDLVRSHGHGFEERVLRARAEHPDGRIVHPYFGPLPWAVYLKLTAEHTRHHGRNLP